METTNKEKNIFILLGHTDCETFCGGLVNKYEQAAREAGYNVKRVNICDVDFDPILHHGYKKIQELEPGLIRVQNLFKWADHVVIFYPNWWGSMPAILKGMFDRMWLPGFAFRFHKKGIWWDKLLKGKSASVIITMNTNKWLARILYGDNSNEIRKNILWFAGFSPVKVYKFSNVEKASEEKLSAIQKKVRRLGKYAK